MKVRDTAAVYVTEELPSRITRRRRAAGRKAEVVQITVDPRVLRLALKLADGDRSRLVIESEESVLVLNLSRRRR